MCERERERVCASAFLLVLSEQHSWRSGKHATPHHAAFKERGRVRRALVAGCGGTSRRGGGPCLATPATVDKQGGGGRGKGRAACGPDGLLQRVRLGPPPGRVLERLAVPAARRAHVPREFATVSSYEGRAGWQQARQQAASSACSKAWQQASPRVGTWRTRTRTLDGSLRAGRHEETARWARGSGGTPVGRGWRAGAACVGAGPGLGAPRPAVRSHLAIRVGRWPSAAASEAAACRDATASRAL